MTGLGGIIHCRNCKKQGVYAGGYCEKCWYYLVNAGGATVVTKYCEDCGVVVGPYERRCGDCSSLQPEAACPHCSAANIRPYYKQRGGTCCDCHKPFDWPKPLDNNCGVCGQNVSVTKNGECGGCYKPKVMPVPARPQRPDWDAIWIEVADTMSRRSTCPRLAVGAVAVRDNQLLATAYNGAPRGLPHCIDVGCDMRGGHCVRAVHAEQNIVAQAAYRGTSLDGATLYSRHGFCVRCANLLIQAGISDVVYVEEYANGTDGALDALRAAGINTRQWKESK